MLATIITPSGINIHIPGMGMKSIPVNSPMYKPVVDIVMDGINLPEDQQLSDNEKIHRILRVIDREAIINKTYNDQFSVIDGNVQIEGEFVPVQISKRLIDFIELKYDTEPIIKFWKHLRNNPSERSRVELLSFLEKHGIPISEDGCFVAYKYVNSDFTSKHDRRYDNSPGNEPYMDRSQVNDDSSQTCSQGLHVAAWEYVKGNSTVVAVKVNPVDVVSIPYDYEGQKMRVCRYLVLHEVKGEFNEPRYEENGKRVEELNRNTFEYMTMVGNHVSSEFGTWSGITSHKKSELNGLKYKGNNLNQLHQNFIEVVNTATKDTKFNYLRMKRDPKGGFLKSTSDQQNN